MVFFIVLYSSLLPAADEIEATRSSSLRCRSKRVFDRRSYAWVEAKSLCGVVFAAAFSSFTVTSLSSANIFCLVS